MDRAEVLKRLKQLAHDMMASKSGDQGEASVPEDADDLSAQYGFNSIDALEYLLALEEEFEIMFEDDDLSQDILASANRLADYILARRSSKSGLSN